MESPQLFTCLSCSIAFLSAEEQRVHYRTDFHRYNMKRRVASLPPVSGAAFDQKVLDRRAETAIVASPKATTCEVCRKSYTTENAWRSHVNSKKHKDNEALKGKNETRPAEHKKPPIIPEPLPVNGENLASQQPLSEEEEINQTIDQKIAAARSRLSPNDCLFCPNTSPNLGQNLSHMSIAHSFFIPDAEYLVDLTGLVTYLGEKIAVGNVCIYCNERSKEFRTLHAVRKHMVDKGHCKIAYDSEDDRLEISDYYDFTFSYPDADQQKQKKQGAETLQKADGSAQEWEDMEEGDDASIDEVVDEEASGEEDSDDSDSLPDNRITYEDPHLEFVLPSGARIAHRSARLHLAQSLQARQPRQHEPNPHLALARRLKTDRNKSALVPRKGGYGAFGAGKEVVKARNRGEAREAERHVREFRDQKRRDDFKTLVGFKGNQKKHYRDPCKLFPLFDSSSE